MKLIENHANPNVNKILVANKCEVDSSIRVVTETEGRKLAQEYGIKFIETSAKTNMVCGGATPCYPAPSHAEPPQ
jgi:Ras-related protein Rab-8A